MNKALFLFIVFVLPLQVFASQSQEVIMSEAVEKLSQVRKALKEAEGGPAKVCDEVSKIPDCSFERSCDQFSQKATSLYLYKNVEGRGFPNFAMLRELKFAEHCLKNPFSEPITSDLYLDIKQLQKPSADLRGYNAELKRVQGIFQEAQKSVVAVLKKKRTNSNAAEVNNLIQRVESVRLGNALEGGRNLGLCEDPNANYVPDTNEVVVCPSFFKFPDAGLFSVIAHELGHAIDPCAILAIHRTNSDGDSSLSYPVALRGDGYGAPAAKEVGEKILANLSAASHPFKDAIACLKSPQSIGAKIPSKKSLLASFDEDIRFIQSEAEEKNKDATMARILDEKNTVAANYEKFKDCGAYSGSTQVQEAFSDWIGAKAVEEKLSEFSDAHRARTYAFESQALQLSIGCKNVSDAVVARIKSATKKAGCETFAAAYEKTKPRAGEPSHDHPEDAHRTNRIYFASPKIRKALGCNKKNNGIECK